MRILHDEILQLKETIDPLGVVTRIFFLETSTKAALRYCSTTIV